MGKDWTIGAFAIAVKILCNDGGDGHGNSDEAVVVNADPNNVEPCQSALGCSPRPALAATALVHPGDGPYPWLHRVHISEVLLLIV